MRLYGWKYEPDPMPQYVLIAIITGLMVSLLIEVFWRA